MPLWWISNLCRHLINDLWQHSLHQTLPTEPPEGTEEKYPDLRRLFILSLFARNTRVPACRGGRDGACAGVPSGLGRRAFGAGYDLGAGLRRRSGRLVCLGRELGSRSGRERGRHGRRLGAGVHRAWGCCGGVAFGSVGITGVFAVGGIVMLAAAALIVLRVRMPEQAGGAVIHS